MCAPLPSSDRATAWRWLLPSVPADAATVLGFGAEESALLAGAILPATPSAHPGGLVVVNVDRFVGAPPLAELQAAGCVALIGSRKRIATWLALVPGSRRRWHFALLPTADPRVVVPLSNAAALERGLALHRPGRWIARVAISLGTLLSRVHLAAPLWSRQLVLLWFDQNLQPRGLAQAGLAPQSVGAGGNVALYLGGQSEDRKTVVLPLQGVATTYIVKQAESPAARASLWREAETLRRLAQSSVNSMVPHLLSCSDQGGALALHQEYRPRRGASATRVRTEALRFLSALQRIGSGETTLARWCEANLSHSDAIAPATEQLRDALRQPGLQDRKLHVHLVHGDFAPWNCSMTPGGFFVYDWEHSREKGLAFSDAFHFVLAPALLLREMRHMRTELRNALKMAEDIVAASSDWHALHLHLAAWLAIWNARRSAPGLDELRREVLERIT